MKIQVYDYHIEDGIMGSSHSCPIALAIRDVWPNAMGVYVDRDKIQVTFPGRPTRRWSTSPKTRRFIDEFDETGAYHKDWFSLKLGRKREITKGKE